MSIENLKATLCAEAVIAAFTAFVFGGGWVALSLLSQLSPDTAESPLSIAAALAVTYFGYLGLKYLPGGSLPWQSENFSH